MTKVLSSKRGLIWTGGRALDASEADWIARENGYLFAEQLVDAFAGKEFTVDNKGKIQSRTAHNEISCPDRSGSR